MEPKITATAAAERAVNWPDFQRELAALINRYSLEAPSNTPDYVLAEYLTQCLVSFNIATEMALPHRTPQGNVVSLR